MKTISLNELLDSVYICRLGLLLRHALLAVPGIPLGFSLEIQETRPLSVDVSLRCLFKQGIQLEQLVVSWTGLQFLDIVCRSLEFLVNQMVI